MKRRVTQLMLAGTVGLALLGAGQAAAVLALGSFAILACAGLETEIWGNE